MGKTIEIMSLIMAHPRPVAESESDQQAMDIDEHQQSVQAQVEVGLGEHDNSADVGKDVFDPMAMKVADLKEALSARGLSTAGRKSDLQERLVAAGPPQAVAAAAACKRKGKGGKTTNAPPPSKRRRVASAKARASATAAASDELEESGGDLHEPDLGLIGSITKPEAIKFVQQSRQVFVRIGKSTKTKLELSGWAKTNHEVRYNTHFCLSKSFKNTVTQIILISTFLINLSTE